MSSEKKPLISVIVPIYNVEKYIEKCIRSILSQTLKDIEIICVDDCSPDASDKIIERYATQDSRISLIKHKQNLGLGGARNTGIQAAKADFIASVDSDDSIHPNMLSILWKASKEGLYDIVCCGFDHRNEAGDIIMQQIFEEELFENKNDSLNIFATINPAFWNKLWRRSLYADHAIFFPEHLFYEDFATTPKVLKHAKTVKTIKDCLYHYLIRDNSITAGYTSKHLLDYYHVFNLLSIFLKNNKLQKYYNDEFNQYIMRGVHYHSQQVLKANLSEGKIQQYLRHLLMLKIAFLEYRTLIDNTETDEIRSLLDIARSKADLMFISNEIIPTP